MSLIRRKRLLRHVPRAGNRLECLDDLRGIVLRKYLVEVRGDHFLGVEELSRVKAGEIRGHLRHSIGHYGFLEIVRRANDYRNASETHLAIFEAVINRVGVWAKVV